ncbi:A/G-specific adenine glycosylase [Halobacteriales archaeon QS_3_64_16]|nr:MAG: A/G-specific adenine glycosylase [Halobacteriales archaeon QS_3_64_16]
MGEGVTEEGKSDDPSTAAAEDGSRERLPTDLEAVREALLVWYENDHREFPWRETDDPYAILVSEVMSQQTQLDRVVKAWGDFLERWPTVAELASADRSAVVSFWSEHRLGYNNRAKYLHEAAGQVVEDFDGEFPRDPDGLQALQGVGPYTANAVASFAFNSGEAVVDTNVKRVLYRAFSVPDEKGAFEASAGELMPPNESRAWNNAIMELGGTTCEKSPRCDEKECPWREWCDAYASGDFSAPDVPTQSPFEGSRRQFRGRIVDVLRTQETVELDDLGPRVRVDYAPEGTYGRAWLRELAAELAADGIVEVVNQDEGGETTVRLRQ